MVYNYIYEEIPFDEFFPIRINFDTRLSPLNIELTPMWHEQMEILYFHTGGAYVICGKERYLSEDGDIFIINPCELHTVYYGTRNSIYDCIIIDPKLYSGAEKDICELKYLTPMANRKICFDNVVRNDIELTETIERILNECTKKEFAYEISVKGDVLKMLVHLFRTKLNNFQSEDERIRNVERYQRLETVFAYMNNNYKSDIPLETLAKLCNMNPAHFCRVFKQVTGKTSVRYLSELRFSKAEILLKTTDKSITDIAEETGFTDSCYFSRRFKQFFGITPMQMRSAKHIPFYNETIH